MQSHKSVTEHSKKVATEIRNSESDYIVILGLIILKVGRNSQIGKKYIKPLLKVKHAYTLATGGLAVYACT